MAWSRVCGLDDLWAGEMRRFYLDGVEILLVHTDSGRIVACPLRCPHQASVLDDGLLEADTLTCAAHLWTFDLTTGEGIRPTGCALTLFATCMDGDEIYVDVAQQDGDAASTGQDRRMHVPNGFD